VRGFGPWHKLLAEVAAAVASYFAGYRIDALEFVSAEYSTGAFAPVFTILWFVAITNCVNLMDGLDGLAAGAAVLATAVNFALAISNGHYLVALCSASLAGALAGFLRFNFYPASIFLGDSGSMFIGYALAATSLLGATSPRSGAVMLLAPIVALGIPLMDLVATVIRRAYTRRPILVADRGHLHHCLLAAGLTHRGTVLALYGWFLLMAGAALVVAFGGSVEACGALATAGCSAVLMARIAWWGPIAAPSSKLETEPDYQGHGACKP
jgi:UDP-GlcNAc:undecaprenyl-phosphate/decaprenyl-phosphate GlcNAc-1-phosphate transferase